MRQFLALLLILITTYPVLAARSGHVETAVHCNIDAFSFEDIYDGKPNYNAEVVAAGVGIFSAMSYNAYWGDNTQQTNEEIFDIEGIALKYPFRNLKWNQGQSFYGNTKTGLQFKVFYRSFEKCTQIIFAIRGTENNLIDWRTNLNAGLGIIDETNQYNEIDKQYLLVKDFAEKKFQRRLVYIATGHSLGGGLSKHLADCWPRTMAITFNTSFVVANSGCKYKNSRKLDIHEKGEIFYNIKEFKRNFIGTDKFYISDYYNVNSIELSNKKAIKQHSMLALSAGILRLSLNCLIDKEKVCELTSKRDKEAITIAKHLYCRSLEHVRFRLDTTIQAKIDKAFSRSRDDPVCW